MADEGSPGAAVASGTVASMIRPNLVTSDEVNDVVKAYLADRTSGPYITGQGVTIDVAAALEAHAPSAKRLADAERDGKSGVIHDAVRTAVLLYRPAKGNV